MHVKVLTDSLYNRDSIICGPSLTDIVLRHGDFFDFNMNWASGYLHHLHVPWKRRSVIIKVPLAPSRPSYNVKKTRAAHFALNVMYSTWRVCMALGKYTQRTNSRISNVITQKGQSQSRKMTKRSPPFCPHTHADIHTHLHTHTVFLDGLLAIP